MSQDVSVEGGGDSRTVLDTKGVFMCLCVFQRVLRSAGGSAVPVPVGSRRTGAELSQAASSAPAACRATVWTHNTTATVTPTA